MGTNYRKMSVNNRNIRPLIHYDGKGIYCQNYDRSQIRRQSSPPHTPILLWILLKFKISITTGTDLILAYNKPEPLKEIRDLRRCVYTANKPLLHKAVKRTEDRIFLEEAFGHPGRALVGRPVLGILQNQDEKSTEGHFPKEEPLSRTKQHTH